MALRSTNVRWGVVTRALHWSIAVMIFGMIAAGLYAVSVNTSTPAGEQRYFFVIDIHKSFGLLILALAAFRVIWRATEKSPDLPPKVPLWETILARVSQALLYVALFLMPVTGYLWASAYGEPVRFFGFKLPNLIHLKGGDAKLVHHIHIISAFILMGIIGMHVAGALKNHFFDRNEVLRKMLGLRPRDPEVAA